METAAETEVRLRRFRRKDQERENCGDMRTERGNATDKAFQTERKIFN